MGTPDTTISEATNSDHAGQHNLGAPANIPDATDRSIRPDKRRITRNQMDSILTQARAIDMEEAAEVAVTEYPDDGPMAFQKKQDRAGVLDLMRYLKYLEDDRLSKQAPLTAPKSAP